MCDFDSCMRPVLVCLVGGLLGGLDLGGNFLDGGGRLVDPLAEALADRAEGFMVDWDLDDHGHLQRRGRHDLCCTVRLGADFVGSEGGAAIQKHDGCKFQ